MKLQELPNARSSGVDYQKLAFDYERHADQDADRPARHPVVVVGAGPVGLVLAIDLARQNTPVLLTIGTPEGNYRIAAGYVAACDGSRSSVRQLIGQESKGGVFKDRFLIADVKMKLDSPAPGRPKPGERPLGGQRGHAVPSVGAE